MRLLFFIILLICCSRSAKAHGPVHEQIDSLSKQISMFPDSLNLYFERGVYYQIDKDYERAVADFEKVLIMDNQIFTTYFPLAEIYFETEKYELASQYIDEYIIHFPQHANGHILFAKAHLALGEDNLAIAGFDKAIAIKKEKTSPEDFIHLANVWRIQNPEKAYKVLEEGVSKLGPYVSLQKHLIELANEHEWYDRSMQTINTVLAKAQRKEFWLLQKADVLLQQGKFEQAKMTYQNCLAEIAGLKPKTKETEYVQTIYEKATLALSAL